MRYGIPLLLGLMLVGCVMNAEVSLTRLQEGWPDLTENIDWAIRKQETLGMISSEDRERIWHNLFAWQEALIFENVADLHAYRDNGWFDEFVIVALWDADNRGDIRARRSIEAYSELTLETLR